MSKRPVVIARSISPLPSGKVPFELTRLTYDLETLCLRMESEAHSVEVVFDEAVGFRVLDEGDLLEFWPTCSVQNGWLYQIDSNGWMSLEKQRGGFLLSERTDVHEFFVAGENDCVSVFATTAPRVVAGEL